MTDDLSTPGRVLFPEYPTLGGMYEREVDGLTEEQLDTRQPEKSWGAWSIRDQVSHIAFASYRWFLDIWGETLFGDDFPRDRSLIDTGGADRLMDPARFHELPDLLAAAKDGFDLAWEILEGEALGSLREKSFSRRIQADAKWDSGDTRRAWAENSLKIPPAGYGQDENDPDVFHHDLEYTFRHVIWEAYAHLKTIQAHKKALGLPPRNEIPEIGYMKILTWE
jgi:hypothetical protein